MQYFGCGDPYCEFCGYCFTDLMSNDEKNELIEEMIFYEKEYEDKIKVENLFDSYNEKRNHKFCLSHKRKNDDRNKILWKNKIATKETRLLVRDIFSNKKTNDKYPLVSKKDFNIISKKFTKKQPNKKHIVLNDMNSDILDFLNN